MEKTRKIRFAIIAAIILLLFAIVGAGRHGNIVYLVLMALILAPVYFTGFEQLATLFISLRDRSKFKTYKLTWVQIMGCPSMPIKIALTFYMHWTTSGLSAVYPYQVYAAAGGAVIVLTGVIFSVLTLMAWSTMFVGHGVQKNQELITCGIYSRVRNPIYLADILYWIGLSIGTLNIAVGIITVIYVIPHYILYIKAEEKMMNEHFGEPYRNYCNNVPRLIPSFHAYKSEATIG